MLVANTGEARDRYIVMQGLLIGLVQVFVPGRIIVIVENRFLGAFVQGRDVGYVGDVCANNNIEGIACQ